MCLFLVAVLITAVVVGGALGIDNWPAAIAVGVLVVVAMNVWGAITRPRQIREAFEGERARLLHTGWPEEQATQAAHTYVRQKFNLN